MHQPVSRTREAIVSAFNRLVLRTRRARPPVAHLLREAGVARSTFYKHFDDRDSLLLEAMSGPLTIITQAIVSEHGEAQLTGLLEHFWDQRKGAGDVLSGSFATRLVRSLAMLIDERIPDLDRHDALRIADTQIAMVRLWISGETPGRADVLAQKMIATARAQRNAFST